MYSKKTAALLAATFLCLSGGGISSYAEGGNSSQNWENATVTEDIHITGNGINATANNTTFKGPELAVDNQAQLNMTGGSVEVPQDAFTVQGGSIDVSGANVNSGIWVSAVEGQGAGKAVFNNTTITGTNLVAQGYGSIKNEENSQGSNAPQTVIDITGGSVNVTNIKASNNVYIDGELKHTYGDQERGATINLHNVQQATTNTLTAEGKSHLGIGNSTLTVNEATSVMGDSWMHVSDSQLNTNGAVTLTGAGPNVPYDETTNTIDLENSTWTHKGDKVTLDNSAVIEAANSTVNISNTNLSLDYNSFVELLKSDMTVNGGTISLDNGANMKLWGKENEADSSGKGSTVTFNNAKLNIANSSADDTSYIALREGSTINLNKTTVDVKGHDVWPEEGQPLPGTDNPQVFSYVDLNHSTMNMYDSTLKLDNAYMQASDESTVNVQNSTIQLSSSDIELAGSTMNVTGSTILMNGDSQIGLDNGYSDESKQSTLNLTNVALTMKDESQITVNGSILTIGNGTKVDVSSASISTKPGTATFAAKEAPSAPISVTNNGKLIFANGSATYTTADANNNIQTVATAADGGKITVESNAGLYVDNAKIDNTTKYNINSAIVKTDANGNVTGELGWNGRVFGKNQLQELNKTTGLYENKNFGEVYTGLFAANAMQAAYLSADGPAYDFIDAVQTTFRTGDTTADNANITKALNSSAGLTGLAGVGYGLASFSDTLSRSVNTHDAADGNVWASYIHDKRTVDGLKVGNLSADYDLTYNGAVIGVDFSNSDTTRYGLALAYADGDVSTNGGLVSTQNDADYYGGSLYGVWNGSKGLTYKAELGYTKSSNDLTQYNTGTKITASTDADAVYAGVRAEKAIESASGTWTPYAGLRYTRLAVDDYTDSLGFAHNSDNAGIWNLPVGVAYRHESKSSSGWTYTPSVELGYQFAFGNKTMDETVSFGAGSDLFGVDIAENSFLGRLSFTAANDDLAFGVHYGYQKGSNTDSKAWGVSASLKF
ncbi:autotransporter domain-containing protein [uncultured Megasphaera sp.]|uniref:autotransporter family protein n=1 Tax=uncultured Megasphaera sp. TaxID=165188 RepID=UPI00265ADFB1|nr:autotransporter domain-containing protein [uncultured Megasphaera sp.]